jgi:hypothetical protein
MDVQKAMSYAMQNKGMYVALGAVLVVSLVTLISASIVYDPIRRFNESVEKSPALQQQIEGLTTVSPVALKNAKNAGILIIVGQVVICVAVIAAMVMGYKYGDRVKAQISKSLAMRYF